VEVGTGAEMKPSFMGGEVILRAADGVGPWHEGDRTANAAFLFRGCEQRHQCVDGDGAGQFAGMEGGLKIGGGRILRRTLEPIDREFVEYPLCVRLYTLDRLAHVSSPSKESRRLKAPAPEPGLMRL